MIWILVCIALLVLLGLFWFFYQRRTDVYDEIYAAENCIELAQLLTTAKAAACARKHEPYSDPPVPIDSPRKFVTAAGMTVIYTITKADTDDLYEHYYSVSIISADTGGYTPSIIGRAFTAYIAWLLGIDLEDVKDIQTSVSQNTVYHTRFWLSANDQAEFEKHPLPIPSREEASQILAECVLQSSQLSCSPVAIGERTDMQR